MTILSETKHCAACGLDKPLTDFYLVDADTDRRRAKCAACTQARRRDRTPIERTEKHCSGCREVKPVSEFGRHAGQADGLRSRCRGCTRVETQQRNSDPLHVEYQRNWRQANPDKMRAIKRRSDQRLRYGFAPGDYEALLTAQDGKCAACKTTDPGPRRVHFDVDHCHTSGKVRGLLCHPCNKALGFARDDPAVLRLLADYLEESVE